MKSGKSLRIPKVRVTVMLCLFLYISGRPYVTVLPHFTVTQTDDTQLKHTHTLKSDRCLKMSLRFHIRVRNYPDKDKILLLSSTDIALRYF